MSTLKKWWNKVTTKAKSIKDKFIEIIQNRINNTTPVKPVHRVMFVVTVVAASIVTGVLAWLGLSTLAAPITAALPFTGWLATLVFFWFIYLPAFRFVWTALAKIIAFVIAPRYTSDFTPWEDLLDTPREYAMIFNFAMALFGVGVFFITQVFVMVVNKMVWLFETLVRLPGEVVHTGSAEGFKSNMQAWFDSWRPSMFMEDSLGSVTVKKFHMEEEKNGHKKTPTPKAKSEKKDRIRTVTPQPAT